MSDLAELVADLLAAFIPRSKAQAALLWLLIFAFITAMVVLGVTP